MHILIYSVSQPSVPRLLENRKAITIKSKISLALKCCLKSQAKCNGLIKGIFQPAETELSF